MAGAAALPAAALGGCAGVLDPAGPVGRGDAQILLDALLIMLAIVVPTILLALWMAWRYRASNARAQYRPDWSYSGRIEAVVWSVPTLTIMFLGGVIWIGSHELDPFRPLPGRGPPEEVQVVALDWKWLFVYPKEGVATVNELVIPAGAPVHFSITSASVFNTFFVPRLGSMIYAMPEMVSQLNLEADHPGSFYGRSAHFSGDGFSDMDFTVRSVPAADFAAFVAGARGSGAVLDRGAFAALARPSAKAPAMRFRAVDPSLFSAVASGALGRAPGPRPDAPAGSGREIAGGSRG